MEKISEEKTKDWRTLEYFVPIAESFLDENEDFIIKGIAINETTTLNNVKYVAEELEKASSTFRNVPILLDHKNEVRNIVGRTTENVNWNSTFKRVDFEAKIMDKDIQERIKDGRIGSVSIGAKVSNLVEEEDGSMKAEGISGLEISLVAVAGDSGATLAHALQNSFHLKEMAELKEKNISHSTKVEQLNLEDKNMSEEEQKVDVQSPDVSKDETKDSVEEPEVKAETETEVPVETPKEEKEETEKDVTEEKASADISEMKKQIVAIKELLVEKKQIKEKIMEDNTKGEVSVQAEEALKDVDNRIVEVAGKGTFAMYRDYSREDADTRLKRLVR